MASASHTMAHDFNGKTVIITGKTWLFSNSLRSTENKSFSSYCSLCNKRTNGIWTIFYCYKSWSIVCVLLPATSIHWVEYQNPEPFVRLVLIWASSGNLLQYTKLGQSKQTKQKVPDFGIPPSVNDYLCKWLDTVAGKDSLCKWLITFAGKDSLCKWLNPWKDSLCKWFITFAGKDSLC